MHLYIYIYVSFVSIYPDMYLPVSSQRNQQNKAQVPALGSDNLKASGACKGVKHICGTELS